MLAERTLKCREKEASELTWRWKRIFAGRCLGWVRAAQRAIVPQPMLATNLFDIIILYMKEYQGVLGFPLTLKLSLLKTNDALWLQGLFTFKSCSFLTTVGCKCKEKKKVDFKFLFLINPKPSLAGIVCIKTFFL